MCYHSLFFSTSWSFQNVPSPTPCQAHSHRWYCIPWRHHLLWVPPALVNLMLISVMCCVGCAWSLSRVQLFVTPWTDRLCPWGFFRQKNTGVGCHTLLQEIFSTQGLNPGLPHCRWILYHLNHQGSPILATKLNNCFVQFFLIRMQASREQELCSIYLFKPSA